MEFAELEAALAVQGGSLSLSGAKLPGTGLDTVLKAFNAGSPIEVAEAATNVAQGSISLEGKTSFANVPGASVEGRFSLDGEGNPHALIRMAMPAGWTFSRSFPDSPEGKARESLDALELTDAFLVFSSQAGADTSGAPLAAGLNVIATLHLGGIAAVVDAVLHGTPTTTLHATLTPPGPAQLPELPFGATPWDAVGWTVPGIAAEADLGVEFHSGEASFEKTRLRFYSPPSTTWLQNNPSYEPSEGFAALFKLTHAEIEAELTGELPLKKEQLAISAEIAGATGAKLEKFAGFAPGSSLVDELPSEVKSALEAAENLSLTEVAIGLEASGAGPSVSFASFTVGYAGSGWTVFPGLDALVSSAQFFVGQPFSGASSISVVLGGTLKIAGQPLDLVVQLPQPVVRGQLPTAATVDLDAFTRELAPELKLPKLTIDEFSFYVAPGSEWLAEATLADEPGWEFEIGSGKISLSDLNMQVSTQAEGELQGAISGLLVLDDNLSVFAQYEVPGGLEVRAQLPELKLSQLVALLDEAGITLPAGFDFSLQEPYVLIDSDGADERFTAATKLSGVGMLAFTAQRQSEGTGEAKTGVAVGLELEGAASSLPGLSALQKFESLIGLTELMVVVSSLEQPGFQLPAMSSFGAPALANAKLKLPPQAGGLVRGLNVYAKLSAADSPPLKALSTWLKVPLDGTVGATLGVSLPDPATDSKLFLAVKTEVDGVKVVGDLGLLMKGGEPGAFLDAKVEAEVQSKPLVFNVGASVLPNGVLIESTMAGSVEFGPLTVSELAIVIGIDFEGLPTLGFVGCFDVPEVSFDGSLAIFLDSTSPAKSLLAGSVQELNLGAVAKALAPKALIPKWLEEALAEVDVHGLPGFQMPASRAEGLDGRDLDAISAAFKQYGNVDFPTASDRVLLVISETGRTWHLTDLATMTHYTLVLDGEQIDVSLDAQVYIAPERVQIGLGEHPLTFEQGVHVEGELDLWVVKVRTQIEAGQAGLTADVEMAPIELGPGLLKVTDDTGATGPRLSLSTFAQPGREAPFDQPHFLLTGRIEILGLDKAGIEIEVGADGLLVDVSETIAGVVEVEFKGTIKDASNLELKGAASVGIDKTLDLGHLGEVHIDDKIAGSIGVKLAAGVATAFFTGELDFQGHQFPLEVQIPIQVDVLANLPELAIEELGPAISKLLHEDAEKWLQWVRAGVLSGVAELSAIGQVLSQEFKLGAERIASLMRSAQYLAAEVAEALREGAGAAASVVFAVLGQAGYDAVEAAEAIERVFKLTLEELAEALKAAGAVVQTAANLLKALGHELNEVTEALIEAGYEVEAVAQSVESAFDASYTEVARALLAAGLEAEEIGRALDEAFEITGREAGVILKEIGIGAEEVASVLRNVFDESAEAVTAFLVEVFNLGESVVEEILKGVGYAWSEVEHALGEFFEDLNPANW